jgi:hypothetical protein
MMSSGAKGPQSHAAEKLRQLYQITEDSRDGESELIPFFCVEARVDFNDVRTGFRETVSLSKALEIYSTNADLLWTDDMVRDVNLLATTSSVPNGIRLGILPDFVDANFLTRMENQFVQYLLRSFEARIYRNFDLNLYSFSGESRADFCRRCLELFDGQKRQELDRLHEVFNRKLEQIRQKYLSFAEPREFEQAKSEIRNKDAFSRFSERIAELFYMAELRMKPVPDPIQYSSGMQELEERLISLELEAHQAIVALSDVYDEKARAIDEYILHPNLKDVHFVRSCILWMPKGAA